MVGALARLSTARALLARPTARWLGVQSSSIASDGSGGEGRWWTRAIGAAVGAVGFGAAGISTLMAEAGTADSKASIAAANGPLFRFGVIADIQYCDIDDAYNYAQTEIRHYRGTLAVLEEAVQTWNKTPDIKFIADLGDIIDGQTEFKKIGSREGLDRVLSIFSNLIDGLPVVHMIGNHELYNFTRRELDDLLKNEMNESGAGYYSFRPVKDLPWKIIVLNSYEINMISNKEQTEEKEIALQYLERHNPNNLRKMGVNWLDGMKGVERRYVPYNGALGERQLAWLDAELAESDRLGERVVVLAHVPLAPLSASLSCLSWDYTRALEIFDEHPSVVSVLAGHDHAGGYWKRKGVHYLTFPSPLNVEDKDPFAHGVVDVHADKLVVHGFGGLVCTVAPDLFTETGRSGTPFSAAVLRFADAPDAKEQGNGAAAVIDGEDKATMATS